MASERWIIAKKDGSLFVHTENDGASYLRRGPEAVDTPTTLQELKNTSNFLYLEALRELKTLGIYYGENHE